MNIDQYSPQSGRFLKEDGTYINIADALGGTETGQIADIEKHAAHSGRFIKEDGTVINIADMIANGDIGGGGGSDSGSSDDSAPPIVEAYNGQVIQSFISADRPLKGLNLYTTCEQDSVAGNNLFNKDTIIQGSMISAKGELISMSDFWASDYIPVKPSTTYKRSSSSPLNHYYDSQKQFITNAATDQTINTPKNAAYMRFSDQIANGTTVMLNEGSELLPYEPYTGGIPSPNGDYPQEIQTISNFAVEVKNSMGEVVTPQTLNVTIPEQGFYGIPVSAGENYTDTDGQRWVCDEIDCKNKKIIKRVEKKVFNGSESWNITNLNMDGLKELSVPLENAADTSGDKIVLCNRGKNIAAGWLYAEDNTCYIENGLFRYCKSGTDINTNNKFKTWVATHNIEIIYLLDEPVEYDLTNEQVEQFKKLKSYYGTTYIDNDAAPACNMTAEIIADTKLYIDDKLQG